MEVMTLGSVHPASVQDILADVLELPVPMRIGVVNVAVELLDAHVCGRSVDTNRLKRIDRVGHVGVEDQGLLVEAINTLENPENRRRLLDALLAIKREFGVVPRKAFAA